MQQLKISLTDSLAELLEKHKQYGFKDKSSMVRAALTQMQAKIEHDSLANSAELYAEIYKEDPDLQDLTNAALTDWPE